MQVRTTDGRLVGELGVHVPMHAKGVTVFALTDQTPPLRSIRLRVALEPRRLVVKDADAALLPLVSGFRGAA